MWFAWQCLAALGMSSSWSNSTKTSGQVPTRNLGMLSPKTGRSMCSKALAWAEGSFKMPPLAWATCQSQSHRHLKKNLILHQRVNRAQKAVNEVHAVAAISKAWSTWTLWRVWSCRSPQILRPRRVRRSLRRRWRLCRRQCWRCHQRPRPANLRVRSRWLRPGSPQHWVAPRPPWHRWHPLCGSHCQKHCYLRLSLKPSLEAEGVAIDRMWCALGWFCLCQGKKVSNINFINCYTSYRSPNLMPNRQNMFRIWRGFCAW